MDIERGLNDTPAIAALRGKVEVSADPDLARSGPAHWPARVEIKTSDGRTMSSTVVSACGDPGRPFSLDDAKVKFQRVTATVDAQRRSSLMPLASRWLAAAGCDGELCAWIEGPT